MDIPPGWRHSAEKILKYRWRKTLVVGGSDCGKSSYCRFLCRRLRGAGFPVAFVDADVGQKDVGPPATISLAVLKGEGALSKAEPEALYFVGSTSPVGRMLPMIVGTRKMVDAADTPFVVVDTTGLVHGPGRILKGYQIDSIVPDALVFIEYHQELEPLARSHRTYNILRVRPSCRAVSKSRQERMTARESAFKAYFARAGDVNLKIPDVVFQRFAILGGYPPIQVEGCADAEEYPDGMVGVADRKNEGCQQGMTVLPPDFERNLLCGVLDGGSTMLGLALLQEIDFSRETIWLYTPVPAAKIRVLQGGDLYLDREGRELAHRLST